MQPVTDTPATELLHAVWNALGCEIAVVDQTGPIRAANQRWLADSTKNCIEGEGVLSIAIVRDLSHQRLAEEEIHKLAYCDPLSDEHFVSMVSQALKASGANPNHLKIELTETMLGADAEATIAKMKTIRVIGVTFSLDNFGTSYSLLNYLKRIPVTQLKLDQSFVRDVITDTSEAVIARTVVALGHSLCVIVIAEGYETQEQANYLRDIQCDASKVISTVAHRVH
jgi:hypothetical protein